MSSHQIVQFLKPVGGKLPGQVANLANSAAEHLIANGFAVPVEQRTAASANTKTKTRTRP